jgi:ADP-heptose:LPS heptosyltransferase
MKILVIQLARFGDVYQTWPCLLALREKNPEAEIHLLVRERFSAAVQGLSENFHIHKMDTGKILESFYLDEDFEERDSASEDLLFSLTEWLAPLVAENFEEVFNLSYSPVSSYLTSILEMNGAHVTGYSRHGDGYLQIPDDTSAYFYAQAGVGRANRLHLTQLFAMTCDVDLKEAHLHPLQGQAFEKPLAEEDYFVLHVGASDFGKALSPEQIKAVVKNFLQVRSENLVLVGVEKERFLAEAAKPLIGSERITDLVGKTRLNDLFSLLAHAKGLIGCDSAPIHMASLLNKPVLNFSGTWVNSFETGPFSQNFFVLQRDPAEVSQEEWKEIFERILSAEKSGVLPRTEEVSDQQWKLIQTLYMGEKPPTKIPRMTAVHLSELAGVLPQVFEASKQPTLPAHRQILETFDRFLSVLEGTDPFLAIFVRWFNTERVRIRPGNLEQVTADTLHALHQFHLILTDWVRVLGEKLEILEASNEPLQGALDELIRNFRFMNVATAVEGLEQLLPDLLSRPSTEVQGLSLKQVTQDLEQALNGADYSRIADILEYQLKPHFQNQDVIL